MKRVLLAGAGMAALVAIPAVASGLDDWSLSPYTADFSAINLSVGGAAQGSLFGTNQNAGTDFARAGAGAAAELHLALQRDYDSGMVAALKSSFVLYHDRLTGDNYGNDLTQKVYFQLQTGLGTLEAGMNDGAAYTLSISGPVVDDAASLDNPNATFFRNPAGGHAFVEEFTLNSKVEPTYNYSKFSYFTPRLFGLQLGVSYTPSQAKDVIPFLTSGPKIDNLQESFWETALNYRDSFGPFDIGLYAGGAFAHDDEQTETRGHKGLTDWAFGGDIAHSFEDGSKLSAGGAFHRANSYLFDVNQVFSKGRTSSLHASAKFENGPWSVGAEYGDGNYDGDKFDYTSYLGVKNPTVGVRAYALAAGYKINDNLSATLGWQELRYARSEGAFYNGQPKIAMDAIFLHLNFAVE
jgi:hypothetical protein